MPVTTTPIRCIPVLSGIDLSSDGQPGVYQWVGTRASLFVSVGR